jgi:hypothetical protein
LLQNVTNNPRITMNTPVSINNFPRCSKLDIYPQFRFIKIFFDSTHLQL